MRRCCWWSLGRDGLCVMSPAPWQDILKSFLLHAQQNIFDQSRTYSQVTLTTSTTESHSRDCFFEIVHTGNSWGKHLQHGSRSKGYLRVRQRRSRPGPAEYSYACALVSAHRSCPHSFSTAERQCRRLFSWARLLILEAGWLISEEALLLIREPRLGCRLGASSYLY